MDFEKQKAPKYCYRIGLRRTFGKINGVYVVLFGYRYSLVWN
jgi:hypothetical protein